MIELADSSVRTRALRARGLGTRALEAGPADAEEAVLFVHGGPGSAEDWSELLPKVGAFARAIAVDLPGFGCADKPARWDYHAHGWARFIAEALDGLGVARAHLVLNDLGGEGGLTWAAANPDAVGSVVLIDTGVLVGYRWHAIAKLHRTPLAGRFVALSGRIGLRSIMGLYEPRLPRRVVDRWRDGYDRGTRMALLRFYRATPAPGHEQLSAHLRALDVPVLVLWGAKDRFVPVEQARRQRESFRRAEVIVLGESGHYPHLTDPERVEELVIPFFERATPVPYDSEP